MTQRQTFTWASVLIAVYLVGILLAELFPRYDLSVQGDNRYTRFDRWTGRAEVTLLTHAPGAAWLVWLDPERGRASFDDVVRVAPNGDPFLDALRAVREQEAAKGARSDRLAAIALVVAVVLLAAAGLWLRDMLRRHRHRKPKAARIGP